MDKIARYNRKRWRALAARNALFTRPHLDLDPAAARYRVDPDALLGDLSGRDVLCLAGGGGQQSAAFALLGASVTVADLSPEQLDRDLQAAEHYGYTVRTLQADMRDLSALGGASFDLVYQPYSIGFVPDAAEVFAQVARALRSGGTYYFAVANPFTLGLSPAEWDGKGYSLRLPYVAGAEVETPDQPWAYGSHEPVMLPPPACREYRHTLAGLVNSLVGLGFHLSHVSDSLHISPDLEAAPGSWDHFAAVAPPFLGFLTRYEPEERGRPG